MMRWLVWNALGCVLWFAGLAIAKGMSVLPFPANEGHPFWIGLLFGIVGLTVLMFANVNDAHE